MEILIKNWQRSEKLSKMQVRRYSQFARQNLSTAGQFDIKYHKLKRKLLKSPQYLGGMVGNDMLPCYQPKVMRNQKYYREKLKTMEDKKKE